MLKSRKSQGLSITTVMIVVIGLIVIVVLIAVLSGRVGQFEKDVDTARTCYNACSALGKTLAADTDSLDNGKCTSPQRYIGGDFTDDGGYDCYCT